MNSQISSYLTSPEGQSNISRLFPKLSSGASLSGATDLGESPSLAQAVSTIAKKAHYLRSTNSLITHGLKELAEVTNGRDN